MQVATATETDLAALAGMRQALGWHPNHGLLRAVHRSDLGQIFLIRPPSPTPSDPSIGTGESNILAAAAAVGYGARGFIGNVIVDAAARRQGLGRTVMLAALDWLRSRHVRVVDLDATPEGRPLYGRLGFVGTQHSWFMHAAVGPRERALLEHASAASSVRRVGPDRAHVIAQVDRAALGGDRLDLIYHVLAEASAHLLVARDATHAVVGYVLAQPLDPDGDTVRIGPWVGTTPGVAAELLLHALDDAAANGWVRRDHVPRVLACVAGDNESALDLARACHLEVVEDDLRMRLPLTSPAGGGPDNVDDAAVLGRPDWIYAMMAQMVG